MSHRRQLMEVCSIVDLNPRERRWVIHCRVTSKSPIYNYANDRGEGQVITVDLEDASGEIRGVAFHQLVDKVNRLLEVDKEYFISGRMGCLMNANKQHNPLDHDYEIRFKDNTCIKESTEGGNNRPTVQDSFVRLSEVPLYKDGTYIDVAGIAERTGSLDYYPHRERNAPFRVITLIDNSAQRVTVKLWNKAAQKFDGSNNPVLVLKDVKVKFSGVNGTEHLSSGSSTLIDINPERDVATNLRKWYAEYADDRSATTQGSPSIKSTSPAKVKEQATNLDNKDSSQQSAWRAAYEEALEKQGSVSVEMTRCLFIGPPAVGKSSLKHLLIHNKSKAVKISTRVMESPDVVRVTSEQYTVEGGLSSWKLLDGKAMIESVQKTAIERKYQSVDDSPTQGVHLLVESGIPDTESMNIEKNRSDCNNMDSLAITDMKPIMEKEKVSKLEQAFADMHKEISAKDGITLNDASFIHLLDSGGQPCFLDTLPLLLGVPCTYILVFNASQDQDQPFPVSYRADEKHETALPPSQTGQELIRRMMSSFHTMGEKHSRDMSKEYGAQSPQLRIYLIGTFKDVLQRNEVLQQKCSEISNVIHRFRCLPSYNYIVKDGNSHPFFLINNNITADPKCSSEDLAYINYLRSSISQSRFALKMDVPLMWYVLQQVVHRAGGKLMRFTELRDFARNHQLRNFSLVASEQQFSSFVKLFTLLGFFVYFDFPETPDESKWVCTDATFFYSEVSKLLSIQFTKVFSLESRVFKQTGVIGSSPSSVLEELQISKDMDPEWLFKALVHTGIAANINGTCQKLFIPVALPLQDQPPYTTSVSVVCASFKFQNDAFTPEFISLPQGLYCRVIVKLANRRFWKLLPEESTRTSVKFLWSNSHILLIESADRLEVAVTFHESFLPCDDSMKVVHDYCCSVLDEVKTSMKKVADDIFGEQNPDIGDVVVGFRCPCDDKMPHLAIAVKDKNPSMRCVGGKMKGQFQKLSLDQMIWFAPLLQNQAKLTLQHSGDLKFYKLCCGSEPSPFQNGSSSSTGTDAVSNSTGSHTTIHGGVHYNIGSVTNSSMSPGSHHHSKAGGTQAESVIPPRPPTTDSQMKRPPNHDSDRQKHKKSRYSNVNVDSVIRIMTREKFTEGVKNMLTYNRIIILHDDKRLISDECKDRMLALLTNGKQTDAANHMIDYFHKNHDGSSLEQFCNFLRREAEKAGSAPNMISFSEDIMEAMDTGHGYMDTALSVTKCKDPN